MTATARTAGPARPDLRTVTYRIDAADRIVEVGGRWDVEAAGGPVVGRSLWHFVAGRDVCAIWELLLRRVRSAGAPVSFDYRCDSPDLQRRARMELALRPDESVAFVSTILHEVPGETLVRRWLRESARVAVACSWCLSVRVDDGWVPPEDAADQLGIVNGIAAPRLSYGVCERCSAELRALADG